MMRRRTWKVGEEEEEEKKGDEGWRRRGGEGRGGGEGGVFRRYDIRLRMDDENGIKLQHS